MNAKRLAAAILSSLAVLAGCSRPAAPERRAAVATAPRVAVDPEQGNLLDFAKGAAVVSRTGEASLELSALRAIDGDPGTAWVSVPDNPKQTLVFSLPSPARLTSFGILTTDNPAMAVRRIRVSVSDDGHAFTEAGTFQPKPSAEAQSFPLAVPRTARYLRLETLEGGGGRFLRIHSVYARGEPAPAEAASLGGCWDPGGIHAAFDQKGASVRGTVGSRNPYLLDGGSDGRFYRFVWVRGPQFGFAAVSLSPDGRFLSGLQWHEEPLAIFFGDAWYGERVPCAGPPSPPPDVMREFLALRGRFPLYGLRFDQQNRIDESASAATLDALVRLLASKPRVRMVSRAFREDPDASRRTAQARLDALRESLARRGAATGALAFVALGSDDPPNPPVSEAMRSLYGCVEVEALR